MANQDHMTSGSTGNRHKVVSTLICVLAAASVNNRVQAAPLGAVQVPEDGYLYAQDDEELTDATDGLTLFTTAVGTPQPQHVPATATR